MLFIRKNLVFLIAEKKGGEEGHGVRKRKERKNGVRKERRKKGEREDKKDV